MRIIVINNDRVVSVDGVARDNLDLSGCGLPANFWAFQWGERGKNSGHIEYDSPMIQNDEVTEIPAWVNACINVLNAKIAQEEADAAAAAQQTTQPV